MTGVLQSRTLAGSLLVMAATGIGALAQNPFPPEVLNPKYGLTASPPATNADETAERPSGKPVDVTACCPPGVRGAFAQYWQRHRAHMQAKLWGYPEEFDDAPLGASVGAHTSVQIGAGVAARMALYQYDFVPSSDQLKPRGKAELARIAQWLPGTMYAVLVEPTPGRPDLDEARRNTVWLELTSGRDPIPTERIVIGRPGARGLGGAEALAIDRNLITQTLARGARSGGGGGGSGMASDSGGGEENGAGDSGGGY